MYRNILDSEDTQVVKWLSLQPQTHGWSWWTTDHMLVLVDLSKAFDTVPHQLVLTELEIACITQVLDWFCNYLTDQLHRVIIYEEVTEWMTVFRGFPEGSGLIPLLFNIFVRKLPKHCTSSTFQLDNNCCSQAGGLLYSTLACGFIECIFCCDVPAACSCVYQTKVYLHCIQHIYNPTIQHHHLFFSTSCIIIMPISSQSSARHGSRGPIRVGVSLSARLQLCITPSLTSC